MSLPTPAYLCIHLILNEITQGSALGVGTRMERNLHTWRVNLKATATGGSSMKKAYVKPRIKALGLLRVVTQCFSGGW